jgi:uncharacterized alkaline shock family protein YloU
VTRPGAPVRVIIEASALYGQPIRRVAERLRAEVDDRLRRHTELNIVAIDIAIGDIQEVSSWTADRS